MVEIGFIVNPENDNWHKALRLSLKRQRLNKNICNNCGYSDIRALQNVKLTLCADCRFILEDRIPVENHHLFGKAYPFLIPLSANEHAIITDMMNEYRNVFYKNNDNELKALLHFKFLLDRLQEITTGEIEKHIKENS
jgi:hypothetical protein